MERNCRRKDMGSLEDSWRKAPEYFGSTDC
jgi:hypothetical protein